MRRAVALLALAIREPADGVQIGTLEQPHAVVERQPLAGVELVGDVGETEGLKAMHASSLTNASAHAR